MVSRGVVDGYGYGWRVEDRNAVLRWTNGTAQSFYTVTLKPLAPPASLRAYPSQRNGPHEGLEQYA